MFFLKSIIIGLCLLASSLFAEGWTASPIKIEADPKLDVVDVTAVYEAANPNSFPVFSLADDKVRVIASNQEHHIDTKSGRYEKTYRISMPMSVVAGEQRIAIPYTTAIHGDPQELIIIVKTPEVTLLSDRRLVWGRNASPDAKKVTVALISPEGYELKEAKTVKGGATAKIRREAPHRYTILVTPADTATPGRSVIEIKSVGKLNQKTSFVVYAEVR